jgi:hypothetical protein
VAKLDKTPLSPVGAPGVPHQDVRVSSLVSKSDREHGVVKRMAALFVKGHDSGGIGLPGMLVGLNRDGDGLLLDGLDKGMSMVGTDRMLSIDFVVLDVASRVLAPAVGSHIRVPLLSLGAMVFEVSESGLVKSSSASIVSVVRAVDKLLL